MAAIHRTVKPAEPLKGLEIDYLEVWYAGLQRVGEHAPMAARCSRSCIKISCSAPRSAASRCWVNAESSSGA